MDPKTLTGASRRPVLDRHLSGRAPGLALLRNRLRTRTGPRLPIAIDNIADLSIDAAVQQPGGGVVDVFSRSRSRSNPRDTGIAQRLLLRPLDRHDGQFILDGAVLFTADLRSLRLGVRRRRQALFLDRGNSLHCSCSSLPPSAHWSPISWSTPCRPSAFATCSFSSDCSRF